MIWLIIWAIQCGTCPDTPTELDIPADQTQITDDEYKDCINIIKLTLHDGLKSIGKNAFSGCTKLEGSLLIPASVTVIGDSAFLNTNFAKITYKGTTQPTCTNAFPKLSNSYSHEIYVPANFEPDNFCGIPITVKGEGELPNCQETISFPDGTKYIPDNKYWGCDEVVKLEWNDGLEKIGQHSFQQCANLEGSLVIPQSVKIISDQAFYLCSKISSLTLHDDIVTLGQSSFWGCSAISGTVEIPAKLTEIKKWAFGATNINSFVFGSQVTSILEGAFMQNPSLEEIIIPDTVQTIDKDVFKECSGLRKVTFGNNLNLIGTNAFLNCANLEGPLVFPSTLQTIQESAFSGCTKLEGSLLIPTSVTTIGASAFLGTSFLEITYEGTTQPTCTNAFPQTSESYSPEVYVPADFEQDNFCGLPITEKGGGLPICQETIVIPAGTKSIPAGKYWGCKEVVKLELNDGLEKIGQHSFQQCANLEGSLVIPQSVKIISDQAFYLCSKITSLTLHDDIVTLGQSSFWGCSAISGTVEIPATLTEIKKWAFGATNIKSFVFGSQVTSILEGAFMQNPSLEEIIIPDTVQTIDKDVFKECSSLRKVTFGNNLNLIGTNAFLNCANLEGPLEFPSTLNTIQESAFSGCTKLEGSLLIPASVTTIGASAFLGTSFSKITYEGTTQPTCTNAFPELSESYSPEVYVPDGFEQEDFCGLPITVKGDEELPICQEKIIIPAGTKYIPDNKYLDCAKVIKLELNEGLEKIGQHSFQGCINLEGPLEFPSTLKTIQESAFSGCTKLEGSLLIPASVTTIDASAFLGTSFSKIIYEGTTQPTCTNAFPELSNSYSPDVYVPDGFEPESFCGLPITVKGDDGLPICQKTISIPDGMKSIPNNKYWGCDTVVKLELNEGLEKIGQHSFQGCINLEGPLEFPSTLKTIQESAFSGCTKLKGSLLIPASVTNIGASAFLGTSFSKIIYEGTTQPTCTNAFPELSNSYSPEVYVPADFEPESFCGLPITAKGFESSSDQIESSSETNDDNSDSNESNYSPMESSSEQIEKDSEQSDNSPESIDSKSESFDSSSEDTDINSNLSESSSDQIENNSELSEKSHEQIDDSSVEITSNQEQIMSSSDSFESSSEPVKTPLPDYEIDPPVENQNSSSDIFEIIDTGYKSQEEFEKYMTEKNISESPAALKTITFTKKNIKVTENRNSSSSEPFYFVASQEDSTITIDKNVVKSSVGISSINTPTVAVEKYEIPLSFLNNITKGEVEIDFPSSNSFTQLKLRDVNNRRGSFSLSVPSSVKKVSFLTIWMYRESTFEINHKDNNNAKYLSDEENEVDIIVEQLVDIASNSKSLLKNVALLGKLSVYDDSSLSMIGNSNISENSVISLTFKKAWEKSPENPVINIEQPINYAISKIVLSSKADNKKIKVTDFPIIGSKSFTTCDELGHRIQLDEGIKGEISFNCNKNNGNTVLSVTVKEKVNKKKLSGGAIAGIVIACLVVLVAIIVLIVYYVKHKNYEETTDEQEVSELRI